MKKLLITGFEPFGNCPKNPSWMAVEALPERVGDYELKKRMLPTVYGKATQAVLDAAKDWEPDVILCIGQAGGRASVTPERIAVNIRDARIPDNAGNQPVGDFVVKEGPAAYFATVPVLEMARAMETKGIPATVSNSAGAFVCNDTLYGLLHAYAGTKTRVGFIHVPNSPELGEPSLPLETIAAALVAAIEIL